MKDYRYLLIFILSHLVVDTCKAQAIIDSYIITLPGDSLKGQVKLPGDRIFGKNVFARLGGGVTFKPEGGGFKFYPPDELKEFGYYTKDSSEPVKRYVSEKFGKHNRLLILKVEGPLRLYRDVFLQKIGYNSVAVSYDYIKKKDAPLHLLADKYYFKVKRRGPLREYLGNCPGAESALNDDVFDPEILVTQYNQNCK